MKILLPALLLLSQSALAKDTIQYARECEQKIGIPVPSFSCDDPQATKLVSTRNGVPIPEFQNADTCDVPTHGADESKCQTGTRILKFMLNVSRQEQAVRLQDRVDDPTKQWKFKSSDLATRAKWDEYMAAYEVAIGRCSTDLAPWHVIPADRNWLRNAAVARIVRETLEEMNPQYPAPRDWDPKTVKIT